jgi:hypothetical protein
VPGEGDYRNWDEIAAWAGEIADALETWVRPSPTGTGQ